MDKRHILDEIRRTAADNGGVPLGTKRFERETGIRYADWFGKYWAKWGDALCEAGYAPNKLRDSFSDEMLLDKLVAYIRELRHFPSSGELRLNKRRDPSFPSHNVFSTHFGSRNQQRRVVVW